MNKYTKYKIWFNLEKIISIATGTSIIVLTAFLMNSCTSTNRIYYEKFHAGYCDKVKCNNFKNSINSFDI